MNRIDTLIARVPKERREKVWRKLLLWLDRHHLASELDNTLWQLRNEAAKRKAEAAKARREALCAPYRPWQPGEPFRLVEPHEHRYEPLEHQGTGPEAPAVCIICGEATGNWDDVNVSIALDGGECDQTVRELFGGGDHPVPLTLDAIVKEIESCGSKQTVLEDWDLIDGIDVTVFVEGLGNGDVWSWRNRVRPLFPTSTRVEPTGGAS